MLRIIALVAVICALSCIDSVSASKKLLDDLVHRYQRNTLAHTVRQQGRCTPGNIAIRREWGELSKPARLDYIRAVKCLHRLPSKIDPSLAPGARTRYDDFHAAHIIQTLNVHATGSFFAWHRWFVHLYETALRQECGYKGYQPYWDWPKYAFLPTDQNPLYDGSSTSMSGNGYYIPNRNGTLQPFPIPDPTPDQAIYTPPGTGGGYIFSGPLVNWTQNLGPHYDQPVANGLAVPRNPNPGGRVALGFNPRPIIRDFNGTLLRNSNTYASLASLLTANATGAVGIGPFQTAFFAGPHLAGHSFISGVDNDLFTSPGDPLFWFHHAQVDRIWSVWQAQDFGAREHALAGTLTLLNDPPSRDAALDDPMVFEFAPDVPVRLAMSPTAGGMCYIYV